MKVNVRMQFEIKTLSKVYDYKIIKHQFKKGRKTTSLKKMSGHMKLKNHTLGDCEKFRFKANLTN